MERFANIPVQPGRRIIDRYEISIEGIPALIQQWSSDRMLAESVIFRNDDVAGLDDMQIHALVKANIVTSDNHKTLTRTDSGHIIVNINILIYDDLSPDH